MVKSSKLFAYGCGSPIRLGMIESLARGSNADGFFPEANPAYRGGNSLVWGLIRGAPLIMQNTTQSGFDFYQIDNAYFGRELFFRITKNAVQMTKVNIRDRERLKEQFRAAGLTFQSWKKKRTGPIILCTSSEYLYQYYNTTMNQWIESTILKLRQYTDRKIVIRLKSLKGIEYEIADSWCVVTHTSAAALDALRIGIPVIVTEECAATPLATSVEDIENPKVDMDREELFSNLAYGQFSINEMTSGYAWQIVHKNFV